MSIIVLFPFLLRIQSRIMFVFVCHISLAYNSSTFPSFHSPSQLFCELPSSWDLSGSFLVVIFCLFFSKRIHCTVVLCAHCHLRSTEYRVSSHGWCWVGLLGNCSVLRIFSCKESFGQFFKNPKCQILWLDLCIWAFIVSRKWCVCTLRRHYGIVEWVILKQVLTPKNCKVNVNKWRPHYWGMSFWSTCLM